MRKYLNGVGAMHSNYELTKHLVVIMMMVIAFSISSCDNLQHKGKELVNQAQEKVEEKSSDLVDKVIPHFDAYEADTKHNKARFSEFLRVELTEDVKNIYCFGDAIGIDAKYQFSFSCDTSTVRKIIAQHQMVLSQEKSSVATDLVHEFDWWNKKDIGKLDQYVWQNEQQYFKYFWYDKKAGKAYFLDFDL